MSDLHAADRSPGSAVEPGGFGDPADELDDDYGPPDWFAACAEPEPERGPERGRGPESESKPASGSGPVGEVGIAELPGLLRASELAGGRRRRRTAVAEERADEDSAGAEWRARTGEPGERRAARRAAGGRRSGGRAADGSADGPTAAEGADGGRRGGRGGGKAEEPADPEARAREICLRLLTGAAKTRRQLADALRKREIPDEVAEDVLSRFEEVGLIDDAAFADAWVEFRHHNRGLSRRALAQELRTKGVAGDLVEQAVAKVEPEDETDAARALVERKLRTTRGLERETRIRRLVGMLARRGYSEGLAFRVVREALDAEGGDGDGGPDGGSDGPW